MSHFSLPKSEVYWYSLRKPKITKLDRDLSLDVAIIGGGMAGLMCAQKLKAQNKNLRIAVIESSICGGGASGKGAGCITPYSEYQYSDLVKKYGQQEAQRIWGFVEGGITSIKKTIERLSLNMKCDFTPQDALYIARTAEGYKKIVQEYNALRASRYDAHLYPHGSVETVVGSPSFTGAVEINNTFGVISYLFCQDLRDALIRENIAIYEHTTVDKITAAGLKIGDFTVTAERIVVCTDRFLPNLKLAASSIHHTQTFWAVSQPLSHDSLKMIFPTTVKMLRDTDYFTNTIRIVQGNRLLFGTTNLLYAYGSYEKNISSLVYNKMRQYMRTMFPDVYVEFEYMWSSLSGSTKDFLPVMGKDDVIKNVYFAGGDTTLPWSAALGEYIADKIIQNRDDFDEVFSPHRKYPIGDHVQLVLRKPLTFAVSHALKKYFNK
jgi:glycine/D-amino acid oxidase-like deaminating enzyme